MQELIDKLRVKIHNTPANTKENRRVRGVYTDCLMIAKEILERKTDTMIHVNFKSKDEDKWNDHD